MSSLPPSATLQEQLERAIAQERWCAVATVIDESPAAQSLLGKKLLVEDERTCGTLGSTALDDAVRGLVSEGRATLATGVQRLEADTAAVEVLVEVFAPPERLFIVGAVHVAIHLTHFASRLGFHTTVIDARSAFATEERFPHADELIVEWPAECLERLVAEARLNRDSSCAFLTHDQKLDNPALVVALEAGARYVGALGSTRTHAKRLEALREEGVSDELLERIHAPIGLDLGGRLPEEIALSIAAELVVARHGRARSEPT